MKVVINEKDLLKIMVAESHKVANKIFNRSQDNIINNGTSDEGTLLKSGLVDFSSLGSEIVYDAPHAESIEYGAVPHSINPEWLFGWVRRKLGISGEKEVRRVSNAIANSIRVNGLEAQPFLEPAINEVVIDYEGIRA